MVHSFLIDVAFFSSLSQSYSVKTIASFEPKQIRLLRELWQPLIFVIFNDTFLTVCYHLPNKISMQSSYSK